MPDSGAEISITSIMTFGPPRSLEGEVQTILMPMPIMLWGAITSKGYGPSLASVWSTPTPQEMTTPMTGTIRPSM